MHFFKLSAFRKAYILLMSWKSTTQIDFDILQWLLQFASKIYIDIYLSSRNIVGTPNNELCTEDVGL